VAERVSGIVAPALSYGFKSQPKCGGGQQFCGTTSLDAATLARTVNDIIREFARHGVRKLVVLNGHYENQWFLIEGIDLAMRELGPKPPLTIMRMEYWDFFSPATLAGVFPSGFPGYALEHAAVIETSMMLHYHPDLVPSTGYPKTARPISRPTTSIPRVPNGCRHRVCCLRLKARAARRAS
jgi:creatinine amidohydrolase